MPHNNLSDALLSLSEAAIETATEQETLRECLRHLASIADTEYTAISPGKEASGIEPRIQEMLNSIRKGQSVK